MIDQNSDLEESVSTNIIPSFNSSYYTCAPTQQNKKQDENEPTFNVYHLFTLNEKLIKLEKLKREAEITIFNCLWSVKQQCKKNNLQFHAVLLSTGHPNEKLTIIIDKIIIKQIIYWMSIFNSNGTHQRLFFNEYQGTINYFCSSPINQLEIAQIGIENIDRLFQMNINCMKQCFSKQLLEKLLTIIGKPSKTKNLQLLNSDIENFIENSDQNLNNEILTFNFFQKGMKQVNLIYPNQINQNYQNLNNYQFYRFLNNNQNIFQISPNNEYNIYLEYYFIDQNSQYVYVLREQNQQILTLTEHLRLHDYKCFLRSKCLIFQHICEALTTLHKNNIIHTNINFESILIYCSQPNHPILSNLEKAYFQRIEDQQWQFQNKEIYKPPELKNQIITTECDIYQLGVLGLQFILDLKFNNNRQHDFNKCKLQKETKILQPIFQLLLKCVSEHQTQRPKLENLILFFNKLIQEENYLY